LHSKLRFACRCGTSFGSRRWALVVMSLRSAHSSELLLQSVTHQCALPHPSVVKHDILTPWTTLLKVAGRFGRSSGEARKQTTLTFTFSMVPPVLRVKLCRAGHDGYNGRLGDAPLPYLERACNCVFRDPFFPVALAFNFPRLFGKLSVFFSAMIERPVWIGTVSLLKNRKRFFNQVLASAR